MRNDYVSTGFVINKEKNKTLLVFHKKLNKWLSPGGHIENNESPYEAVLREILEETGIQARTINQTSVLGISNEKEKEVPMPFCILHEFISAGHNDVEHTHVDFVYVLEADEDKISHQIKEVDEARWMTKEEALACDTFDSVKKICERIL